MRGLLGFSVARVSFSALCNKENTKWPIKITLINGTSFIILFYGISCYDAKHSSFRCTAHPKLSDEFCKDAKERFCGRGLAVFSKVRGYLGKLVHCFLLVRVQRLHSWMWVFKKALIPKLRDQYAIHLGSLHLCLQANLHLTLVLRKQ